MMEEWRILANTECDKTYRKMIMNANEEKKTRVLFKNSMAQVPPGIDFPKINLPDKSKSLCMSCNLRPTLDTARNVVFEVEEVKKSVIGEDLISSVSQQMREIDLG
jgi:hypothetical protein